MMDIRRDEEQESHVAVVVFIKRGRRDVGPERVHVLVVLSWGC
jgi:hypothetical protein